MASVTKDEKKLLSWQGVVQGAATALFIALIFGGLQLWANDGRQDERIRTNEGQIEALQREIKEEIRILRTAINQGDGEQRALSLQILQALQEGKK